MRQFHLSEFTSVPTSIFKLGQPLAANLYLYMPSNKSVIFYMREGEILTEQDMAKLAALPKNSLLSLKTEARRHQEPYVAKLGSLAAAGDLASPQAATAASALLRSLQPGEGETTRNFLTDVPKLAQDIVQKLPPTPSRGSFEEALQSAAGFESDPILKHNAEVSAVAVLARISLGGASPEELAQLATAALVHDLGLKQISPELTRRHLEGEEQFTVYELGKYHEHREKSCEFLSASAARPAEAIAQAVLLHHENLDGSGPAGVGGADLPLLARVLKIADDLVILMNHPKGKLGYMDAIAALGLKDRHLSNPIHYDPDVLNRLSTVD